MELVNATHLRPLFVRIVPAGECLTLAGGATIPAAPWKRTAFSCTSGGPVIAWRDGALRKRTQTQRLNGVLYQVAWVN